MDDGRAFLYTNREAYLQFSQLPLLAPRVFNHATARVVQVRRSWFIFGLLFSDTRIFTLERNNAVVSFLYRYRTFPFWDQK